MWAVRRIGELSAALNKAPGRPAKNSSTVRKNFKRDALAEAGLTVQAAGRAERVAKIPAGKFRAGMTPAAVSGISPTNRATRWHPAGRSGSGSASRAPAKPAMAHSFDGPRNRRRHGGLRFGPDG